MFLQVSVILFTGGVPGEYPLPRTATAAGSTHPTGMHSCISEIGYLQNLNSNKARNMHNAIKYE